MPEPAGVLLQHQTLLQQLPDDALLAVCAHLNPGSVAALGGTCRRLRGATAAPHLWRDFCKARWRQPLTHLSSFDGEVQDIPLPLLPTASCCPRPFCASCPCVSTLDTRNFAQVKRCMHATAGSRARARCSKPAPSFQLPPQHSAGKLTDQLATATARVLPEDGGSQRPAQAPPRETPQPRPPARQAWRSQLPLTSQEQSLRALSPPAEDAAQRAIDELLTPEPVPAAARPARQPHQQLQQPPQNEAAGGLESASLLPTRGRKRRRSEFDVATGAVGTSPPQPAGGGGWSQAAAERSPQSPAWPAERPPKVRRRSSDADATGAGSPAARWRRLYASENGWAAPAFRCHRLPSRSQVCSRSSGRPAICITRNAAVRERKPPLL